MNKRSHNGFTLAEILITLLIIGVLSALTIPILKKKSNNTTFITGTKKAYATLSNATKLSSEKNGSIRFWNWSNLPQVMEENYIPHLNIIKDCKTEGGCFPSDYNLKTLIGVTPTLINYWKNGSADYYTFITADGMYWAVTSKSTSGICNITQSNYVKKGCARFFVDINGAKDPNIVGYDVIGFVVTPDGVYPNGGCPDCKVTECQGGKSGWDCATKIIQTSEITW